MSETEQDPLDRQLAELRQLDVEPWRAELVRRRALNRLDDRRNPPSFQKRLEPLVIALVVVVYLGWAIREVLSLLG